MVLLVTCQPDSPSTILVNQSSPTSSSNNENFLEEDSQIEVYERTQAGVVSIRQYIEGRVVFGSGFIVDRSGHVLTNWHVISAGGVIEVLFSSGSLSEAAVIGSDKTSDLAVLEIEKVPQDVQPIPLGSSSSLEIGQVVLAIGNPVGLQNTMTSGIISGLSRYTRTYGKVDEEQAFVNASVVQTDAAINQGNSGGPLMDLDGGVIGITSAKLSSGFDRSVAGIGFATSSDVVKVILPSLIEQGKFEYPYLGILSLGDSSLADLKALDLDGKKGVYIAEVVSGSPAESAGLTAGTQITRFPGVRLGGDLIQKVDDLEIANFEELMAYIVLHKRPGENITLTILRGSENFEIELELGTRP
jgi:2-alkenal reductase